jgi:hypothetical protein
MLLDFNELRPGILECCLNLNLLYPDSRDRAAFEERWMAFDKSDATHPNVFTRTESDTLIYLSETIIPTTSDSRPPLLLLLGNPASHSVASEMFFAFEGDHHEHRFWIGLCIAGILDFNEATDISIVEPGKRNRQRKQKLIELDYSSPFRIGMTVYYTLPSAASGAPWSGVSGIRRLLGTQALNRIAEVEQQRIAQIVTSFMPLGGGIMVFQRDAYEAVRGSTDPQYSLDRAKAGQLYAKYRDNPTVHVVGVAPTRLMFSSDVRDALLRYASRLEAMLIK